MMYVSRVSRNPPNKQKAWPLSREPCRPDAGRGNKTWPLGRAACRQDAGTRILYGPSPNAPKGWRPQSDWTQPTRLWLYTPAWLGADPSTSRDSCPTRPTPATLTKNAHNQTHREGAEDCQAEANKRSVAGTWPVNRNAVYSFCPPDMDLSPGTLYAHKRRSLSITCLVSRNPPPPYTWANTQRQQGVMSAQRTFTPLFGWAVSH